MSETRQKFADLMTPLLAEVKKIASTRPDLDAKEFRFTCRAGDEFGVQFSAFFDCDDDNTVGCHGVTTPEYALSELARKVSEVPKPQTKEQRIAALRAQIAELEGGQS